MKRTNRYRNKLSNRYKKVAFRFTTPKMKYSLNKRIKYAILWDTLWDKTQHYIFYIQ